MRQGRDENTDCLCSWTLPMSRVYSPTLHIMDFSCWNHTIAEASTAVAATLLRFRRQVTISESIVRTSTQTGVCIIFPKHIARREKRICDTLAAIYQALYDWLVACDKRKPMQVVLARRTTYRMHQADVRALFVRFSRKLHQIVDTHSHTNGKICQMQM